MAGAVVGGAEEFFMRLVPALARAGVRVKVNPWGWSWGASRARTHVGVEFRRYNDGIWWPVFVLDGNATPIMETKRRIAIGFKGRTRLVEAWHRQDHH